MDTTVILAQPRASRLRADAVYVVCRGSTGAPPGLDRGSTGAPPGKPVTPSGANFGALFDPPDPSFFYWNLAQQNRALVV